MTVAFSRPSLPPSEGVVALIRRLLDPNRKTIPTCRRYGGLLHRYRQQARDGTLSDTDATWLDAFLQSRDTWLHAGLTGKGLL